MVSIPQDNSHIHLPLCHQYRCAVFRTQADIAAFEMKRRKISEKPRIEAVVVFLLQIEKRKICGDHRRTGSSVARSENLKKIGIEFGPVALDTELIDYQESRRRRSDLFSRGSRKAFLRPAKRTASASGGIHNIQKARNETA
jgi:hypothetical protein